MRFSALLALHGAVLVGSVSIKPGHDVDLPHKHNKFVLKDSVVSAMEARMLSSVRKNAAQAAKFLEEQSTSLGSPALSVLAAHIAQVSTVPKESGTLFKQTRSLLMRITSKRKGKAESLQDWCRAEVQRTNKQFAALQEQDKKDETQLRSMAAQADKLGKDISSLSSSIKKSEKTLAAQSKRRNERHKMYLKTITDINMQQSHLNVSSHAKITLNNAAQMAQQRNALSKVLMRKLGEQSKEASEVTKFAKVEHDTRDLIKTMTETKDRETQQLKHLKVRLIKEAHDFQAVQGDLKSVHEYTQGADEKCKVAAAAQHGAEMNAVNTAYNMMAAH